MCVNQMNLSRRTRSLVDKYKSSFEYIRNWNGHNNDLIALTATHFLMILRIWIWILIHRITSSCQWCCSAPYRQNVCVWCAKEWISISQFNETNIGFAVQTLQCDGQIGTQTYSQAMIWYPYHHSHMMWRWIHIYGVERWMSNSRVRAEQS